MSPADLALGRRAVACDRWQWLPGMLDMAGSRVAEITDNGWITLTGGAEPGVYQLVDMSLPDLSDPATRGGLESLVVAAYPGEVWLVPCDDFRGWAVMHGYTVASACEVATGATKEDALVAALEAA